MTHSDSETLGTTLLDIPFGDWRAALELPENESYRARQVQEWVFQRRVKTFAEMTNLPVQLREKWSNQFTLRCLTLDHQETSKLDGTTRLFFRTKDNRTVSAVLLPNGNVDEGRRSLCLSTQVGCTWGCIFCASGLVRFQRNLSASEMLEQVLLTEELCGSRLDSLLFMGMGEPLANYKNLVWTLACLRSPLGFGFGARHVTVSTCGLVPQIYSLAKEAPKVNLAISLHAADDEVRGRILPKSAVWPIKELLKASWTYQKAVGSGRVTFEYILLKGINDSHRMAQRLANMLRDHKAWVNLIPYNPVKGLPFEKPQASSVQEFADILSQRGIFVRVRKPQGTDIAAGCGQLGRPERPKV